LAFGRGVTAAFVPGCCGFEQYQLFDLVLDMHRIVIGHNFFACVINAYIVHFLPNSHVGQIIAIVIVAIWNNFALQGIFGAISNVFHTKVPTCK